MSKTPLLIPIPDSFDDYLASVSKSARYEHKQAMKAGAGLEWHETTPTLASVAYWMEFWTTQTVEGKHPNWRQWTPAKALKIPGLKAFAAGENVSTAFQLLEVCGHYAYAWPVLYDKVRNPWAAKFMWFNLIRWCCESRAWLDEPIKYLDLGGGNGRTWVRLVLDYQAGKVTGYKWLYVPRAIKEGGAMLYDWNVFVCERCMWRTLGAGRCAKCAGMTKP